MHSIPQHKMMEHLRICKGISADLTFSSNTSVLSSLNIKKSIRSIKTAASTKYAARAADVYEPQDVIEPSNLFEPSYQSVKDLETHAVDEEVVQKTANLPCSNCNRKFMEQDRLDKHYAICSKSKKSRKVFDTVKARVIGTDMEKYALNPSRPDKKVENFY
jgi:hypothetical protein